eukprot:SAG25_NODE_10090_length_346_cov_0.676113_1_plen_67_part_01
MTKVDIAGPDTSGSGMCSSLRKDHGRQLRGFGRLRGGFHASGKSDFHTQDMLSKRRRVGEYQSTHSL